MNESKATNQGTEARTGIEYRPAIEDVSHTHPDTDEAFGTEIAYKRGPTIATDGGREPDDSGQAAKRSDGREHDAAEEVTEADPDEPEPEAGVVAETAGEEADERMCDVEHTPPEGDDINHVYERGGEGRDEK